MDPVGACRIHLAPAGSHWHIPDPVGTSRIPFTQEEENAKLGPFRGRFMVCCNLEANDLCWASVEEGRVGKVSMGKRHRFLTVTSPSWWLFNVAVLGLAPDASGHVQLSEV